MPRLCIFTYKATYSEYLQDPMSFYLNGKTVYLSYYASDGEVPMSTGLKVDSKKFKAGKLPKHEREYLSRIETVLSNHEVLCTKAGEPVLSKDVRRLVLEATDRKEPLKKQGGHSFLAYYGEYLDKVESGAILNDGKKYSDSFIRIAKVVGRLLPKHELAHIPVAHITEADLQQFAGELTAKGLAKNSVATYMDRVTSFLVIGRRAKRHNGPLLETRAFNVSREGVDHGQYLTAAEQASIMALPYEGDQARWRDAGIFGCQVGMRHSDLSRLTPEHRTGDTVNIHTQKTSTPVWVPLNSIARELWDKYEGNFGIPDKNVFMFFFKQMGEDAGIDKQVLFSRTEGGVKIERWVKKWELLGTHTMRRSAATNMYLAKVPVPSIMQITGHKTMVAFLKYIRLSAEEHAEFMAEHAFFK